MDRTAARRKKRYKARRAADAVVTDPMALSVAVTEAMIERGYLDFDKLSDRAALTSAAETVLEQWAATGESLVE